MAAGTVTDFGSAAVKVCSCAKPVRQNRNSTKVAATNFIFRILPVDGLRQLLNNSGSILLRRGKSLVLYNHQFDFNTRRASWRVFASGNRNYWRQRALLHARPDQSERSSPEDAVWQAF